MARLELRELVPHARMPDRLVIKYQGPGCVGVREVGGRSCVYGLIKQESKLYRGVDGENGIKANSTCK